MESSPNYSAFEFEDFIEDDKFKEWVMAPSEEQGRYWRTFLLAYPHKKEPIKEAKAFLLGLGGYFESTDISERELQIKLGRVLERGSNPKEASKKKPKVRIFPVYQRIAVAASVAALLGFFGWYFFVGLDGMTTYRTDFGQWETVELPDGSVVELHANSELIVAKDWANGITRQVWLEGEAFFSVTKKPTTGLKFQVITDDLTVEVSGTEFNVQDRGERTEVYLKEGKIALDLGIEKETLSPGDFIAFSADQKKIVERKRVSQDTYTSWKEGVLQLNNTTVLEILKKIEEIYGVDIKVTNKAMLSEKRTIGVPMENLEVVIPILENTLDVDIRKERNKLFIR
ncbi:MAG: FecR family protein [Cyclobacteriaceae bacterium]